MTSCVHCATRTGNHKHGGLCRTCYDVPEIRVKYVKHAARKAVDNTEMTTEELDAMIAEQTKPENLPDWWEGCRGANEMEIVPGGAPKKTGTRRVTKVRGKLMDKLI